MDKVTQRQANLKMNMPLQQIVTVTVFKINKEDYGRHECLGVLNQLYTVTHFNFFSIRNKT